jgi:hypothetical protein
MLLEHRHGGGPRAPHDLRQCREMGLFALVQGEAARRFDKCRGFVISPGSLAIANTQALPSVAIAKSGAISRA